MENNAKIIIGGIRHQEYDSIPLDKIVGKTLEGIVTLQEDGKNCIVLFFTDGTEHGFYV
jgi:hypothetical protein